MPEDRIIVVTKCRNCPFKPNCGPSVNFHQEEVPEWCPLTRVSHFLDSIGADYCDDCERIDPDNVPDIDESRD